MDNAKYIEVVFENCESIVIPTERVLGLTYAELTPLKDDHALENSYHSSRIDLEISYTHQTELEYSPTDNDDLLGAYINNPSSNKVEDRPNILGRLFNYHDIVYIQLLDSDEKPLKNIYVPWYEEDQDDNRYMKIHKEEGSFTIEIKPE
ncbi:hypothetical protein ACQKIC_16300 [Peribacillus sp. NPDC046944]|uniref:hypothetical protein n=1 Tax=unclassified Peribacillus TaxID=2675266 RepID=UPI003CFC716E